MYPKKFIIEFDVSDLSLIEAEKLHRGNVIDALKYFSGKKCLRILTYANEAQP